MGTLRSQMTDAMKLRRFSPRTQQSYLTAVTALANYYRTPPDQLDFEKIKAYLLHMTVERGLSWSTCNVAVSAFRFFYIEVVGWEKVSLPIPPRKKPKTLPVLRWQARQWHIPTTLGSPVTSIRSWPQEQDAVREFIECWLKVASCRLTTKLTGPWRQARSATCLVPRSMKC